MLLFNEVDYSIDELVKNFTNIHPVKKMIIPMLKEVKNGEPIFKDVELCIAKEKLIKIQ